MLEGEAKNLALSHQPPGTAPFPRGTGELWRFRAARKLREKLVWLFALMGMQGRGGFSNRRSADMEGGNSGMFGASGGNKGGATKQKPSLISLALRVGP